MAHNHRTQAWLAWMARVRGALIQQEFGAAPEEARAFHARHWATHAPGVFSVPRSPAMGWTLPKLRAMAGEIEVEVQAGRLAEPDYEIRSPSLKTRMPFGAFLDEVEHGEPNAVYMTANNAAANAALLARLAPDLMPLPVMLRPDPSAGFVWLSRGGKTPQHHDLTCNILVQLVGTRRVRIAPPSETPRMQNHLHVFSRLQWPGDLDREGIISWDVDLLPGEALFIPVGWWHTVETPDVSIMASFTNFWWPNYWLEGFPP